MEAADSASLASQLQAEGIVPLRIVAVETGGWTSFLARDAFARTTLSATMLAELIRRTSTLLTGGVSVEEALAILSEQSQTAVQTRLVQDLSRRLRDGAHLADAMAAHEASFPPIVVGMVRAGEVSGALPATLGRLADYLQRSEAIRQSIRSALIYPTILVLTASGSVLVVLTVVLPALRPSIEDSGASLPVVTQIAFAASKAVQDFWWAFGLCTVAVVFGLRYALQNPAGRTSRDRIFLNAPILGRALLHAEVARFARTLGVLIGGVALPAALALSYPVVSNTLVAKAVAQVTDRLREGAGLAEQLAEAAIFPVLAVQLVRIGEATGKLDTMLLQLADSFDEQVQRTISRSLAIMVPVITILMGAFVAGIIASVMLAVLSINELAH